MTQVVVEELQVRYGRRSAVIGVGFVVPPRAWVALVGPNGAGKTSVLRAVVGLVRHGGDVRFDGRSAASLSRPARAQIVAYVAQAPIFPVGMTVEEYVLLGRTPHVHYLGRFGRADRCVTHGALEMLELRAFANRPVDRLSGGERQRAAIARALAQEAPVLVLDEPTTALDVGRQQDVLELVDSLRRTHGITVIVSMHDLSLASLYASELLLLANGRVVASGAPRDVVRDEILREHFGASLRVLADGLVVPMRRS